MPESESAVTVQTALCSKCNSTLLLKITCYKILSLAAAAGWVVSVFYFFPLRVFNTC